MRILAFPLRPALAPEPVNGAEVHRRRLLAESDDLLERVELLRLQDQRVVPVALRHAILGLHARAGCVEQAPLRLSVRFAQELIFTVQQRLMAANPRRPSARAHLGRGAGIPTRRGLGPGIAWKLLVLPPPPSLGDEPCWLEMVDLTVERALDRWAYAQHHALRAVRNREDAAAAVARVRTAWSNYWELREEAARLAAALEVEPAAA
jgi:hypothetical protein